MISASSIRSKQGHCCQFKIQDWNTGSTLAADVGQGTVGLGHESQATAQEPGSHRGVGVCHRSFEVMTVQLPGWCHHLVRLENSWNS